MTTAAAYARIIADKLRPAAPGGRLADEDVPHIDAIAALWAARSALEAQTAPTGPETAGDAFSRSLPLILAHEGGYVNHPADPGGATMKGVTQATYDGWRSKQGLAAQSVRNITADEIGAIYRRDYWDAVKGEDLPAGVSYAVFDFAVNSGVKRASRFLQKVVGTAQDGVIGPATIAAVKAIPPAKLIDQFCDDRMAFLRSLGTFSTFGRGWTRRVDDVRTRAKEMAR